MKRQDYWIRINGLFDERQKRVFNVIDSSTFCFSIWFLMISKPNDWEKKYVVSSLIIYFDLIITTDEKSMYMSKTFLFEIDSISSNRFYSNVVWILSRLLSLLDAPQFDGYLQKCLESSLFRYGILEWRRLDVSYTSERTLSRAQGPILCGWNCIRTEVLA